MLIASSPVEIEAKADEAGLPEAAHDAAMSLFHELTDRIGQAVVTLAISYEDWPKHRFYFAAEPAELDRLLAGLHGRADIVDVSSGVPDASDSINGLYARADAGDFSAVMVAHEDHTRYHP